MKTLRNMMFCIFLGSSFLMVSQASARQSKKNFWGQIYQELQSKKNSKNPRARMVRRGKRYFYLTNEGDIGEGPRDWVLGQLKAQRSDGNQVVDSGLIRRTQRNKTRKKGRRSRNIINNMNIPGLGVIPYSQAEINSIYKSLKKDPTQIVVDTEKGIAFYMDDYGQFQVRRLDDVRRLIHPLQKNPGQPIPPAPPTVGPDSNYNDEPMNNERPKDNICTDKKGKKFSGNKNVMASSAQLSVVSPLGGGSSSIENCNAWKVSGDQIMTNAHCVESLILKSGSNYCEYNPNACTRLFKKKIGKVTNKKIKAKFVINGKKVNVLCGVLNAANRKLDYAVLKCRNLPAEIPTVRMATKRPTNKTNMTLATWDFKGSGVRKRVRQGRVINRYGTNLKTNILIKSGNSGSVLYNSKTLEAVGLVHSRDAVRSTYSKGYFTSAADIMKDLAATAPQHAKKISVASGISKVECKPLGEDLFIGHRDYALPTSVEN